MTILDTQEPCEILSLIFSGTRADSLRLYLSFYDENGILSDTVSVLQKDGTTSSSAGVQFSALNDTVVEQMFEIVTYDGDASNAAMKLKHLLKCNNGVKIEVRNNSGTEYSYGIQSTIARWK